MESWMLIYDHLGYAVSNYGQVMNVRTGLILKQNVNCNGYAQVSLGYNCTVRVHRMVAMAFVPNPEYKPYINHLDGIKLNNNHTNLEWCTAKENDNHARSMGLKEKPGQSNTSRPVKLTLCSDPNCQLFFDSVSECSRFLNTNKGSIYRVLNGKRNHYGGHRIEYI